MTKTFGEYVPYGGGWVASEMRPMKVDAPDPRQEQLRRQLANDEPKCGNCRWWTALPEGRPKMSAAKLCGEPSILPTGEFKYGERDQWLLTTDLQVCSRWEPK